MAFTASITNNVSDESNVVDSSSKVAIVQIHSDDDDELHDEVLADAYKTIYCKWIKESQVLENKKTTIESLMEEKTRHLESIVKLNCEFGRLTSKLEKMTKSVKMLNAGTDNLDKIITIGKPAKNMKGLGYTNGTSISKTTFVPPIQKGT